MTAQSDYLTSVKIFAVDPANNPIEGIDFRVLRVVGERQEPHGLTDVINMNGASVIHLGLEERGTFLIQLKAAGFKPIEFRVFFTRGHMQTVHVKMHRTGSSETARIERLTNLTGQVVDHTGSLITRAQIVAVDEKGRRFETTSSPNGYFHLSLPFTAYFWNAKLKRWVGEAAQPSKYSLSITCVGFATFEMRELLITNGARGSLNMDIVLSLMDASPGAATIEKRIEN